MIEPYRDPAQPRATRVDDLLGRLTLREKVGQLNQRLLGWETWQREADRIVTTKGLDEEIARWGGIGAVYGLLRADAWSGRHWGNGADAQLSADVAARVQEQIVAGSRHGIPALFVEETPHGHQALGGQLYPTNVGAAASWMPELVEQAARHIARELRARGTHLALVSGLDLLRDPRWGRAEETFGEDPLLASLFTRAFVRGLQAEPGIAAVLKHLAGQGSAMGGRNASGAPLGPRELHELHLAAGRAGVAEGALGIMAAYNDVDGVPCIADEAMLTGILRDEWGFEGIVVADMFAIDRLLRAASSPAEAAALALRAGVDLSMCDVSYHAIEQAVEEGLVDEALVDRAARRVLDLKIRLGLLDPATPLPSFPAPDPVEALVAAGPVLLQNRGGLLPLDRAARIAVIGPNGDDVDALLGDYVPPLASGVGASVRAGIRAATGIEPRFERGSDLLAPIEGGLQRAAALAADSDVVVLVLGSSSGRGYDDDFQSNGAASLGGSRPHATTGEGYDVAEVELPAAQRALAAAVAETGTPVVAVIVSGRPHGIDAVASTAAAVLYAWYPGPEGGRAIGELLVGDREPSGRLPVSLPHSSGTLPVAYDERIETTLRYIDQEAAAPFPFGAGIGWTTWELGSATASATSTPISGLTGIGLSATLRNTGDRAGTQVVQLYARARIPGILPRRAVLLGFARVAVEPGAELAVTVRIDPDSVPGLGLDLPPGDPTRGRLDLWLSITGAGEPRDPLTVSLVRAEES